MRRSSSYILLRNTALALAATLFTSLAPASGQAQSFKDITTRALPAPFVHGGVQLDVFPGAKGALCPTDPLCLPQRLVWAGGVAIADLNGDGWNDIFATNGKGAPNALYLNKRRKHVAKFREVAGIAGVASPGDEAAGVVIADIDNDGDADIYVSNVGLSGDPDGPGAAPFFNVPGPNRLFLNQGNDAHGVPQFIDATIATNTAGDPGTRSQLPTFVDFDGDGDLDIYIGAHNLIVNPGFASQSASYPFKRPDSQTATLLKNQLKETGTLSFTDATDLLRNETNGVLGADGRPIFSSRFNFDGVWVDVNKDGYPDLLQANDLGAIGLFMNNGNGTFRFTSDTAGLDKTAAWMSMTPGDINGDGHIDFFASNVGLGGSVIPTFQNTLHALYLNNGNATFTNVANSVGASPTPGSSLGNPSVDGDVSGDFGWAGQMFDFDNDGDLDLFFVGNWLAQGFGVRTAVSGTTPFAFPGNQPPLNGLGHTNPGHLFENLGNDAQNRPILVDRLESAANRTAVGINNPRDARSIAVGDLNNDGRVDIVVANVSGTATNSRGGGFRVIGDYVGGLAIYQNKTRNRNKSLVIRLTGKSSNRTGIGARVTVFARHNSQLRELRAGEGHLGANPNELHFGVGRAHFAKVVIKWPSGRTSKRHVRLKRRRTLLRIKERGHKKHEKHNDD